MLCILNIQRHRLKQTFRTPGGELNYAMWTTRDIPEDMGFTYMVGSGCFQKAIQRDLGYAPTKSIEVAP